MCVNARVATGARGHAQRLAHVAAAEHDSEDDLRIASVCRLLPRLTTRAPDLRSQPACRDGRRCGVRILQPVPYFPLATTVATLGGAAARDAAGVRIEHGADVLRSGSHSSSSMAAGSLAALVSHSSTSQRALASISSTRISATPRVLAARRPRTSLACQFFITVRGLETDDVGAHLGAPAASSGAASSDRMHQRESLAARLIAAKWRGSEAHSLSVPNAVDRDDLSSWRSDAARRRLGVQREELIIVSVGHLLSVKRHTVLMRPGAD